MIALPVRAKTSDCEKSMGDESIQIEFTFWNKDLEKSQEPKLRQAAVKSFEHERVCVVGLVGAEGDFEKYEYQSRGQAMAIADYLKAQGVAENRIIIDVERNGLPPLKLLSNPTKPHQNKQIVEIRYFE